MVKYGATDEIALIRGVERNDLFEIPKKNRDKILHFDDYDSQRNFKAINDSVDTVYGNSILSWTFRKIKKVIGGSDQIMRWGGDESTLRLASSDRSKTNITVERFGLM